MFEFTIAVILLCAVPACVHLVRHYATASKHDKLCKTRNLPQIALMDDCKCGYCRKSISWMDNKDFKESYDFLMNMDDLTKNSQPLN